MFSRIIYIFGKHTAHRVPIWVKVGGGADINSSVKFIIKIFMILLFFRERHKSVATLK